METRANYVLIGAFTLAGILGALGLLLWLAKVEVDRQYAYYDILFEDVSGLGDAGVVRYNGLPVGQVVSLRLDDDDPSRVRVGIEVGAETPVKTDTVATLQAQGVTGVSFVALSGGSPEAEPLPEGGVIASERSAIQSIFEGAPRLLDEAVALLEEIREVVNTENRAAVESILANLSSASGRLDQSLADFGDLSDDLSTAAQEVAAFTGRLEALADTADTTLTTASETLTTATGAIERAQGAIETAETAFATADTLMQGELTELIRQGTEAAATLDDAIQALEPAAVATMEAARGLAAERLPALVDEVAGVAGTVETEVARIGTEASGLIARYSDVGAAVQARAEQAETALSAFETATNEATAALDSIRRTSDAAAGFIETDGRPLAAEATATLSAARGLAEERLPGLIDQANTTLATIDREASALSLDAQELIATGTARLNEAQETISQINATLMEAGETLDAIENASESVTTIVQTDGAALAADARAAAAEAREAITAINTAVREDLPGMVSNISEAADTANRVIGEVGAAVEEDLPVMISNLSEAAETANGVIGSVGANVAAATEDFDLLTQDGRAALTSATDAFNRSIDTLDLIDSAMVSAETTLVEAEKAFSAASKIIDEDFDAIVVDIRAAASAFTTTIQGASGDIDRIADEVLSASQAASNVLGTIDGVVTGNRRELDQFVGVGLPEFVRLTEEGRRLLRRLDRLVDRLERDPGRFLLGTTSSDFRR